jgi:hypothetical protein
MPWRGAIDRACGTSWGWQRERNNARGCEVFLSRSVFAANPTTMSVRDTSIFSVQNLFALIDAAHFAAGQ